MRYFRTSVVEGLRQEPYAAFGRDAFELAAGASPRADMAKQTKAQYDEGILSGFVLTNIIGKISLGLSEATLESVMKVAVEVFRRRRRVSLKTINNSIWPTYRQVSHLWAATWWRLSVDLTDAAVAILESTPRIQGSKFRARGHEFSVQPREHPRLSREGRSLSAARRGTEIPARAWINFNALWTATIGSPLAGLQIDFLEDLNGALIAAAIDVGSAKSTRTANASPLIAAATASSASARMSASATLAPSAANSSAVA